MYVYDTTFLCHDIISRHMEKVKKINITGNKTCFGLVWFDIFIHFYSKIDGDD